MIFPLNNPPAWVISYQLDMGKYGSTAWSLPCFNLWDSSINDGLDWFWMRAGLEQNSGYI